MGASFIPIAIVSCFWGVVGLVLPCYVPNDTNKGVIQLVLRLTGATCWLFWLCCYMAQMNPLIGPKLHNSTILLMAKAWGNDFSEP